LALQSYLTGADRQQPADHGSAPRLKLRYERYRGSMALLLSIAAFVGVLAGWSLGGDQVLGRRVQEIVEAVGIVLAGICGLMLGIHIRRRSIRIERAYSTHLEELSQRLRSLAYQDSLTSLYNHRYFYEQLDHEVERAHRYGRPVSVILLDLDHFKSVNDTYGHLMGDKLLALVGQIIKDQVRRSDVAARYGGDEFAIILPDTTAASAEATAQKLARAIATGRTSTASLSENLPLSASYGVACCPDDARSVSELLQQADDHVYAAKHAAAPNPLAPVP
jgi:diguanylate cyclase (GGDEF)-like protein